jgi:hypothetical protein
LFASKNKTDRAVGRPSGATVTPRLPAAAARRSPLARAVALSLLAFASAAPAADTDPAVLEQLQRLSQRLQQLERRNEELERRLREMAPAPGGAPATTATTAAGAAATAGTAAATAAGPPAPAGAASAAGPQWGDRLQALEREQRTLAEQLQSLSRPLETPEEEGPSVEGTVLAVGQRVNGGGSEDGHGQGRLNYRGDVLVRVPAGYFGDARATAAAQLRFGQGGGVATRPTYTGTVNSTTFEAAAGSDQTYAVIAQALYSIEWPLDAGRFNDQPGTRAELTLGKLDLFTLFDQNEVAGDEAASFLNNVFVHNPILDSGGDIGADSFGFAPGLRAAYFDEGERLGWGVSAGVFASGEGAGVGSPGRPLVIVQAELSPRQINGEARGNYRLYAWTNGRTTALDGETEQRHTGFGLSVDQKLGREWNLFGRYGQRLDGDGSFDKALTLGFEHGGRLWGRARDAVGLALGWLHTDSAWRRATADGTLAGYRARGAEQIAELYYRLRLNDRLDITPDFQLLRRAGGDGDAPTVSVFGLRGTLGF